MQIEINMSKLERGTHEGRVKVTRGGKTFYRKQRVGQKEIDKKISYKSSHDFMENKINLNIDMRENDKFTKDSLMGEQIIVNDEGNKLDVWIRETSDMIQLSTIKSRREGTGLGTKYLLGLKKYADVCGKKLVIPNMTPSGKKYFSRFNWLKDDFIKLKWIENGKLNEYYPSDTMSYTPTKFEE